MKTLTNFRQVAPACSGNRHCPLAAQTASCSPAGPGQTSPRRPVNPMKTTKPSLMLGCALALVLLTAGCKKADPVRPTPVNTGVHLVDANLVGKWLWTQASDGS